MTSSGQLEVVEYGIRDWSGQIIGDPDWHSVADVIAGVAQFGYTVAADAGRLVKRTRTITTTAWEPA